MSKKIAKYKKRLEELTEKFQFFHLNPNKKDFDAICGCAKLRIEQGLDFDIWKLAALSTYKWGSVNDTKEFKKQLSKIMTKLDINPTKECINRAAHIYFATGHRGILDAILIVGGSDGQKSEEEMFTIREERPWAPIEIRNYAVDLYQTIKTEQERRQSG